MSNQYWNGSNGNVWLNDKVFEKVKGFEIKMIPEWEDVPNGLSTERVLLGYSYEGKFAYRKTDGNCNTAIDLLFEEYSKGIVPDVSLVGKAFNGATKKTQRIKASGITFDELVLQQWEEKSVSELELTFKASSVKVL